jgi:muconolactone D-isomerase
MRAEFLVHIELAAPPGMSADALDELRTREAQRARELVASGNIVRLWRASSSWGNWGLWRSETRESLVSLIDSLPLRPFMSIEILDLGPHPSDPMLHPELREDGRYG